MGVDGSDNGDESERSGLLILFFAASTGQRTVADRFAAMCGRDRLRLLVFVFYSFKSGSGARYA